MGGDAPLIRRADLADRIDARDVLTLLDEYAQDLMGGGKPLPDDVKSRLPGDLSARPGAVVLLARIGAMAAGLAIAFEGYSTFRARPLLNLHDFVVGPAFRRRGVALALLDALQTEARDRGCCKITLEVLENNGRARQVYARFGFVGYELDPAAGKALFLEKDLKTQDPTQP
ncbi:MAG TPA: GNAT family N-acetyltransferase [Fibrobacteria bacterium]|nr:GNAT family N-acetyltransferase [Fibrobacteria bacterium]